MAKRKEEKFNPYSHESTIQYLKRIGGEGRPRKPRKIITKVKNKYPLIEVYENGQIWMQLSPNGNWKKISVGKAKKLALRFLAAVAYAKHVKSAR